MAPFGKQILHDRSRAAADAAWTLANVTDDLFGGDASASRRRDSFRA
jgi:hypothetical protein